MNGDHRVARIAALIAQIVEEEDSVTNEISDDEDEIQSDTSSVKELTKIVAETKYATIDAVIADPRKEPEDDLLVAEGQDKLKCDVPGCLTSNGD